MKLGLGLCLGSTKYCHYLSTTLRLVLCGVNNFMVRKGNAVQLSSVLGDGLVYI